VRSLSRQLHVVEVCPTPRWPETYDHWLPALVLNNRNSLQECRGDRDFVLTKNLLSALRCCNTLRHFSFDRIAFEWTRWRWFWVKKLLEDNAESLETLKFLQPLPMSILKQLSNRNCKSNFSRFLITSCPPDPKLRHLYISTDAEWTERRELIADGTQLALSIWNPREFRCRIWFITRSS